jgi:PAS domain S-box-containing protein
MNRPLRLLLLEDSVVDAELVIRQLEAAGFRPEWQRVDNEADYLAALAAGPEIILSDFQMPGFDALRALRLLQERRLDIPFVMVSGSVGEDLAVAAMKEGAADYLLKDRLGRLGQAVAQALERNRMRLEKERLEAESRETETQLRRLLEAAPDAVVIVNGRGQIVFVNAKTLAIYGYERSELLGQSIELLVPERLRGRHARHREAYAAHPHVRSMGAGPALSCRRKDGSEFLAEISLGPLKMGSETVVLAMVRDVTERQQAEETLRHSERLYHSLVENLPLNIFRKDLQGCFTFVNQRFCRTVGKPVEEILGKTDADLFPPQLAQKYREDDRQVLDTGVLLERVEEHQPLGQDPIQVQVIKTPLRDAQERVVGLQGIFWDVTERRSMEQALLASEERYRTLAEASQDAIFLADLEGRLLYVNRYAAGLFATTPENIVGKRISELFPPELAQQQHRHLGTVRETRQPLTSELLAPFPGGEHWLDTRLMPVLSPKGQVESILWVSRDITQRKEAEASREQLTQFVETLLESSPMAIIAVNLEGRVSAWNSAAERMFGWRRAEVLGQPLPIVPAGKRDEFKAYLESVRRGETIKLMEVRRQRKDGEPMDLILSAAPLRDAKGNISGVVGMLMDITERKRLEAQLLRSQRLESVGRLASGIAHDLNNILAPMLLAPTLLREAVTGAAALRLVDTIEANAKRGADIIKQLLTFGRGMSGDRVPVQLKLLVLDMLKIVRETFPKDIQVRSRLPAAPWLVSGDPTQLHQVLMNLSINARDAMPEGGTLVLGLENLELGEALTQAHPGARPGPYVVLTVSDSGVGIGPEHLDRIFDPFFTTKEVGKGTGLGLATVLGIVRSHGGFILVNSQPGQGTEFKVHLPALVGPPPTEPAEGADSWSRGHGELILVVDDEQNVREVTRQMLEGNGYRVLEATNGAEGLALYGANRGLIQAVITDWLMPVMNGPVLIRELRRLDPDVRIIAASGHQSLSALPDQASAQVEAFLRKPFPASILLQTVGRVLRAEPADLRQQADQG